MTSPKAEQKGEEIPTAADETTQQGHTTTAPFSSSSSPPIYKGGDDGTQYALPPPPPPPKDDDIGAGQSKKQYDQTSQPPPPPPGKTDGTRDTNQPQQQQQQQQQQRTTGAVIDTKQKKVVKPDETDRGRADDVPKHQGKTGVVDNRLKQVLLVKPDGTHDDDDDVSKHQGNTGIGIDVGDHDSKLHHSTSPQHSGGSGSSSKHHHDVVDDHIILSSTNTTSAVLPSGLNPNILGEIEMMVGRKEDLVVEYGETPEWLPHHPHEPIWHRTIRFYRTTVHTSPPTFTIAGCAHTTPPLIPPFVPVPASRRGTPPPSTQAQLLTRRSLPATTPPQPPFSNPPTDGPQFNVGGGAQAVGPTEEEKQEKMASVWSATLTAAGVAATIFCCFGCVGYAYFTSSVLTPFTEKMCAIIISVAFVFISFSMITCILALRAIMSLFKYDSIWLHWGFIAVALGVAIEFAVSILIIHAFYTEKYTRGLMEQHAH